MSSSEYKWNNQQQEIKILPVQSISHEGWKIGALQSMLASRVYKEIEAEDLIPLKNRFFVHLRFGIGAHLSRKGGMS